MVVLYDWLWICNQAFLYYNHHHHLYPSASVKLVFLPLLSFIFCVQLKVYLISISVH